jgi:indole-3-glycerol phosphate synthase
VKDDVSRSPISFKDLLRNPNMPLIIAEVKKSSPSLGVINQKINDVSLGLSYFESGAMAISVLTEPHYFGGDIKSIVKIREQNQQVPILQKDFIVDAYQVYEARFIGADCILLIVALLPEEKIYEFMELATSLGLSVLLEVHNEEELAIALKTKNEIIGINNRNLHTLEISLQISKDLMTQVKSHENRHFVSESGIETSQDICDLQSFGFNAFLIGSSLMKKSDPALSLRSLIAGVKI